MGELHDVRVEAVSAAFTSQKCPHCGYHDALNRHNEAFKCIHCKFAEDADFVGALNVLSRFNEQLIVAQKGES